MGKQFEKKITWVIKNFPSLQSEIIYSDQFLVSGCKWSLRAYPKGNLVDNYLSLFMEVPNHGSIPSGWRRHARYLFTIINKSSEKNFHHEDKQWFDDTCSTWGRRQVFPLNELLAKDSGFLVNGELKIVVSVDVLEIIGKVDVSEESSTITETMDANGFQLLPSQVNFANYMFERHPELASEFRPKNPNLKTAYMSFLLSLISTLCTSPNELSKDDLYDSYIGLGFMKDSGFKLDWLEKKLDELSEKKEKEQVSETRLQGLVEELKDLKQRCSDMEALVDKEKGEVSALKTSLSFHDVV